MRDQAGRLYAAEADSIKTMNEAMTLKECQKFVDKVLARKYIQETYPWKLPIVVHDGRRRRNAAAGFRHGNYAIMLPKWARNEFVILHEIAHHISRGNGHGPEFATCLLDLVRNVMGKEDAELLQAAYALRGVKVQGKNGATKARCPKSKQQWFEERKAQLDKFKTQRKEQQIKQDTFIADVEAQNPIECERCGEIGTPDMKLLRFSADKVQKQWLWKCDNCSAERDHWKNITYNKELHGELPIDYMGVWY